MGERWGGEDKREVGRRMQTWQGCASRLTLETGGGGGGNKAEGCCSASGSVLQALDGCRHGDTSPKGSASHRSFSPCPVPLLTATQPVSPLPGAKLKSLEEKGSTSPNPTGLPNFDHALVIGAGLPHSSRPKDNPFYAAYSVRAGDESVIGEGKPNLSFPLVSVRLDGREKTRMLSLSWPLACTLALPARKPDRCSS